VPGPAGGAYRAPSGPLARLRGWGPGKGRRGWEWRKGNWKTGGEGKEEGRGQE